MEINIRLPRIAAGAISNLVGLAGLVALVVAVGGLTGNAWWSVLAGGVVSVALAWVAQTHAAAAVQAPTVAAAPTLRPASVVKESTEAAAS